MKSSKTPYQRIVRAAKKGAGVRLSYDECRKLAIDDAIETRATYDDENEKVEKTVSALRRKTKKR